MRRIIILFLYSQLANIFSCHSKKEPKHLVETPAEALQELKQGNISFVNNHLMRKPDFKEQIKETKDDQHLHTLILGCIDAQVPLEIIFDEGLGHILVARVAGNVDDDYILGSIGIAVNVKHAKLNVVLGHNHSDAVKGAIGNVELEHLTELEDQIKPAISEHKSYHIDDTIADLTFKKNVQITIQHLLARSKILNESVSKNEIKIIGAFYNIENGEVEFL